MPDGRTHQRYREKFRFLSIITAVILSLSYWWFFNNVFHSIIIFIGINFGYWLQKYIDPDLDQLQIGSQEARLMNDFGIFGVFIVMLFLPYAYIMRFVGFKRRGHRNFFSHMILIGGLIRLSWLIFIPVSMGIYFHFNFRIEHFYIFISTLIGLSIGDTIHFFLDKIKKF